MEGRLSRRRVIGYGLGGIALGAATRTEIRRTMAQSKPETVLYVSNAGGPEIYVIGMNRATGDLDVIERVKVPADKPSPTSMPLALSPDHRFLYAAMRSEPFTVASFGIDKATGKLSHIANAPLTARQLDERAEAWRPWRGYAVMQLWRAASDRPPRPRKR